MKPATALRKDWKNCPSTRNHRHKCNDGILYIAQSKDNRDVYKIGITKSLEQLPKRLKQIEREYQIEFRLMCFYYIPTCHRAFERWFHHRLKQYHVDYTCGTARKDELFNIPDIQVRKLMYTVDTFMGETLGRLYSTDSGINFVKLGA